MIRFPNGKTSIYNNLTQILNDIKINYSYDDNDQDQLDNTELYDED